MAVRESPRIGIESVLVDHDRLVAECGVDIWLGSEPTFTDADSTSAEWRTAALGEDKEQRARKFVHRLAAEQPGCAVLRTLGRQYPGESKPRWNFGLYARRDGQPVWPGPPDLMERNCDVVPDGSIEQHCDLRDTLRSELQAAGFHTRTDLPEDEWGVRLLFAQKPELLQADWSADPRICRPPVQTQAIPEDGYLDDLAAEGVLLVVFGLSDSGDGETKCCVQVGLPSFANVDLWLQFLNLLGHAAKTVGLRSLILTGYPPPVNESVTWTTVTPDPGVLEINMAPCRRMVEFFEEQKRLHGVAAAVGLSAGQQFYNGEVADSGGGQHFTFGGTSPLSSPFLKIPQLLPRLIACLNRHPVLSYWFAVRSLGSCSQQPRADEVSPESLDGLSVALDRLMQRESVDGESIWRSLSPFLCDRFGNTHRCEINIEKFWNPYISDRGCLGLVELRAFRMLRSPEETAAVATFLRTVIVWLAQSDASVELTEWGSRLHDRFSLPFYLQRDLRELLTEMEQDGFGLSPLVTSYLLDDSRIVIGQQDLDEARLTVRQAVEFWPVVGDPSNHQHSSRLMDSSTCRLEILLEPGDESQKNASGWKLNMLGRNVPWVCEQDDGRTVLLRGVRYKLFHPQIAVSPLVDVIDPLEFLIASPDGKRSWQVQLFNWRPGGGGYDGRPKDLKEAQRRRSERLVVTQVDSAPSEQSMPRFALTECCVDLRRIDLAT